MSDIFNWPVIRSLRPKFSTKLKTLFSSICSECRLRQNIEKVYLYATGEKDALEPRLLSLESMKPKDVGPYICMQFFGVAFLQM